jgi:hypothetical protein
VGGISSCAAPVATVIFRSRPFADTAYTVEPSPVRRNISHDSDARRMPLRGDQLTLAGRAAAFFCKKQFALKMFSVILGTLW